MAGEGSRPILTIPVQDDEWQAFLKSFRDYQDALGRQSQAWASTNSGIKKMGNTFENAHESFDGIVEAAESPKLNKAFVTISKSSKETEKSWLNISKTLEKSSKGMEGLLRTGSKFSGLLGFLGLGGAAIGAGAALFGAVRGADNSLASQNILNRKLGLKPGEEGAFTNVYERAGGDDALLHKVANAQAHQDQWRAFMALGLTPAQITGMDAAHLSAEVLRRSGEQFNQRGAGAGMWASATGVDSLIDTNGMRLAGSYQGQFGDMSKQFEELTPKLAQLQKDIDAGTEARQKFDAAWAEDMAKIEKSLLPLNDGFIKLADGITDMVKAFADSGELKHDLEMVSEGFADVAGVLKRLGVINTDTAGKDKGLNPTMNGVTASGWETGNWLEQQFPAYKAWREAHSGWFGKDSNGGLGTGTLDDHKAPTIDSLLDAIKQNESSGKTGKVNPASGAAGLYGLMPDNVKRFGVDPDDPQGSRKAARKILEDQLRAFNGDLPKALAGYDGDTHVAADSKKYGDMWLKGAKQETIDYLKKIQNQGLDIGLTPEQQKYIDAHTKVGKGNGGTSESMLERLQRGFGMIGTAISAGGGSQFRGDDRTQQRIDRQGNQPMTPYQIQVTVSTPAGADTNITAGSLPQ